MWQRMRPIAGRRSIVVTLDETRQAMRLMAEKARAVAEGAGALALAAALTGKAGKGPIVCVVSGGISTSRNSRTWSRMEEFVSDAAGWWLPHPCNVVATGSPH